MRSSRSSRFIVIVATPVICLRAVELAYVAGFKVSGAGWISVFVAVSDHRQVDCMVFGHHCFLAGKTPLPSQSSDSDSCHLRMALICDFRLPFV